MEQLETLCGSHLLLDETVILLYHVIEIFHAPKLAFRWQEPLFL
jgi:hypothetical protein